MAVKVAVVNQKGGVGKTTTATNLCDALARGNKKTLLVDIDPQRNATVGSGIVERPERTMFEVITEDACRTTEAIVKTEYGYDLLAGSTYMSYAEDRVPKDMDQSHVKRLQKALAEVEGDYDFIVIDSPTSLGFLTLNALTAADKVLIPLQPEAYAVHGAEELRRTIDAVREVLNKSLEYAGVFISMYDPRKSLHRQVLTAVQEYYAGLGVPLLVTKVPHRAAIGAAPLHGMPALKYSQDHREKKEVRDLIEDVYDALAYEALGA